MQGNPNLPVSIQEFERRIEDCLNQAAQRGLDGLVVFGKEPDRTGNLKYLANHRPWLPSTPTLFMHRGRGFGAVVLSFTAKPTLITSSPYFDDTGISIERVVNNTNLIQEVGKVVQEAGLERSNLGLVGEDILYVTLFKDLQKELPQVRWEFADDILMNARAVKSPEEVEILEEAAAIGHRAALKLKDVFRPGKTEGELMTVLINALSEQGVTEARGTCQSGVKRSSEPLLRPAWTSRVMAEGDMAHIEIIGYHRGYQIDLCRAGVVGKSNSAQSDFLQVIYDMGMNMAEAAKPGVRAEDLQYAAAELAVSKGMGKYHNQPWGGPGTYVGHGIGLGMDEVPVLAKGDKTPLRSNMLLAIEPGLYRHPLGGGRIERALLITEAGSRILDEFEDFWW